MWLMYSPSSLMASCQTQAASLWFSLFNRMKFGLDSVHYTGEGSRLPSWIFFRFGSKAGDQSQHLTTLSWCVDGFVSLYEYHPVFVTQKNLRFFVKLKVAIIWLCNQINILFIYRTGIWKVLWVHLRGSKKRQLMEKQNYTFMKPQIVSTVSYLNHKALFSLNRPIHLPLKCRYKKTMLFTKGNTNSEPAPTFPWI